MPVVVVDLRDTSLRSDVRNARAGDIAGPLYRRLVGDTVGDLVDVPLRLLVLLPIDDVLAGDAEHLALTLLGFDPAPRTIVATVPTAPIEDTAIERTLPNEFGRHADVRFLELRAPTLSVGHPRTGLERTGTDVDDPWAGEFLEEVIAQLSDRSVFDAVWAAIPQDRPASIGMRVAALGVGRERAVADLALRLSDELKPDREPDMGQRLPERWIVDPALMPGAGRPATNGITSSAPRPVQGLAEVSQKGLLNALKRGPDAYNDASAEAVQLLERRPVELAELFDRAETSRGQAGDPSIDPVGAAALDAAVGGVVFGDDIAGSMRSEDDPAKRVGDLLEMAATRQADGLSAAVLVDWLRTDADAVQPRGPRAAAEELRAEGQPWSTLHGFITGTTSGDTSTGAVRWTRDNLRGNSAVQSSSSASAGSDSSDEQPAKASIALSRTIPRGLRWILGSPIWARRSLRAIFLGLTVMAVLAVVVQYVSDTTGLYLLSPETLGIDVVTSKRLQALVSIAVVLMLAYTIASLIVAAAVRRWARSLRFEEVPRVLGKLESDARALAIAEVARFPARREYARVAKIAAETLEQAATHASDIAHAFGERVDAETRDRPGQSPTSPYREVVAPHGTVSGTDAGGIYRTYPLYVNTLRALYAQDLEGAVREYWPRVRGVLGDDTGQIIIDTAASKLQDRLEQLRAIGIRRGDLLQDGVDPADELAERLWHDADTRRTALASLHLGANDPMPILATPSDARLLDDGIDARLVVAVPSTLEPLVREVSGTDGDSIVLTDAARVRDGAPRFPLYAWPLRHR